MHTKGRARARALHISACKQDPKGQNRLCAYLQHKPRTGAGQWGMRLSQPSAACMHQALRRAIGTPPPRVSYTRTRHGHMAFVYTWEHHAGPARPPARVCHGPLPCLCPRCPSAPNTHLACNKGCVKSAQLQGIGAGAHRHRQASSVMAVDGGCMYGPHISHATGWAAWWVRWYVPAGRASTATDVSMCAERWCEPNWPNGAVGHRP